MRKLIVCNFITIDGLYDGVDGNMASLFAHQHADYARDDSFDFYNAELLRTAGLLLLSGNAFLGNKAYWTSLPSDPDASAIRREYAALIAAVPKLVISDNLTPAELAPWDNTTITHARTPIARSPR